MIALQLEELLTWTDEERAKWEAWFPNHPEALAIILKGDRFGTVSGLIGHIFEAEWRQAHRIGGLAVPERKDPPAAGAADLFASGRAARSFFRAQIEKVSPAGWSEVLSFDSPGGSISLTKRKLALHLPLHETRHWGQIARMVREHDIAPPGKHDLMFSATLK